MKRALLISLLCLFAADVFPQGNPAVPPPTRPQLDYVKARRQIGANSNDTWGQVNAAGSPNSPNIYATTYDEGTALSGTDKTLVLPPASAYAPGTPITYIDNVTTAMLGRKFLPGGSDLLNADGFSQNAATWITAGYYKPIIAGGYGGKSRSVQFVTNGSNTWKSALNSADVLAFTKGGDKSARVTPDASTVPTNTNLALRLPHTGGGEMYAIAPSAPPFADGTWFVAGMDTNPVSATYGQFLWAQPPGSSGSTFSNVISPASFSTQQNNWSPTGLASAGTIRVTLGANANISGIDSTGMNDGTTIVLHNTSAFTLTLLNNVTSTAANRFAMPNDVAIAPDEMKVIQYDTTESRWHCVSAKSATVGGVPTGTGFYHVTGGVADTAAVNTFTTPTIIGGTQQQVSNGSTQSVLFGTRFTDTSPVGHLLLLMNAAGTVNLWDIGIDGTLNTGIIPSARLTGNAIKRNIGFTVDGGGSAISGAPFKVAGFKTVRYSGTITGWSIAVDAGTATVKTWKKAGGTGVTTKPTSANLISTSGVSISTGTYVDSNTVTDFGANTAVAMDDIFAWQVSATSGATELSFDLEITTN